MIYTIIDSKWWTPPLNNVLFDAIMGNTNICIGVVAIESDQAEGAWKCYIGYGRGVDAPSDEQRIAGNGMPLGSAAAAHGFFPSLDIEKYRY